MADRDQADRGDGFVGRWSRRKRAARGDAERPTAETAVEDAGPVAALTPEGAAHAPGEPPATEAPPDLPPIDSLTAESDFAPFMREGVPEELQRLALRKLWRLTPIVPDGLDDYDEDFSMIGMVAEKVSTLFKPGEGMHDSPADDEAAKRRREIAEAESEPEPQTTEAPSAGQPDQDAASTDEARSPGGARGGPPADVESAGEATDDADGETGDADGEMV